MYTITAKFGGSSLADATQFEKVKTIIEADANRRYIIPSAPGKRHLKDQKITDLLYICNAHKEHDIPIDDVYNIIKTRYTEIVSQLTKSFKYMESLNILEYLNEIESNINNGADIDYIVSRGEYLNGIILSNLLNYNFVDPKDIIFFDDYGSLNKDLTKKNIIKKLSSLENAVIPGFYGSSPDGNIKTFSRGGSDITGSIIASCLSCSLYENWTDVSGFLMADPRIVENPTPIDTITYKELRELSYMGATVLHEEAVFPAKEAGIPIHIKNTNLPWDKGTLIIDDSTHSKKSGTITGVAGRKNFTVISIEKTLLNIEIGFNRKLLSILEMNGVAFENMPSGIDSVSLVVEDSQIKGKLNKIIEDINRQCNPDSIEIYPNMALVATVGQGMSKSTGVAAKVFNSLAENNVNIRMINQGSSEINIIVGVESSDFEKAIKSIYNAFA